MQIISKNQAQKILEKTIEEGKTIKGASYWEYDGWIRSIKIRIEGIFGKESSQMKEIAPLIDKFLEGSTDDKKYSKFPIIEYLQSFLSEVDEFWSDTGEHALTTEQNQDGLHNSTPTLDVNNNRIFIVHGHDHGRMQAVARFLEHLGLEPIILHERPNAGNTIIEKFEDNSNVAYAVVLLTPDDIGSTASDRDNLQQRARQNVILELGYFLARLGRRRTAALVVPSVEIPSDYSGILYIPLDKGDEWKLILARELKESGLNVDMNKAL